MTENKSQDRFSPELRLLRSITERFPTPFHLYDEKRIREGARAFYSAFLWAPCFNNYFAVKALPNPHVMKLLREEGMGMDCSSLPELHLAEKIGLSGDQIMFTSNNTPLEEFRKAKELGAIINLDDLSHLSFLEKGVGLPKRLSFRYNPGRVRRSNSIIGSPEEAKYGIPKEDLLFAYRWARERGVTSFGLHTMVASNELNVSHFVNVAELLFDLIPQIEEITQGPLEFVNLGGGIGIPYRPNETPLDLNLLSLRIRELYDKTPFRGKPPKLFFECGRMVTGPHGVLVTKVRHIKRTYRTYVGVDACSADLMRPAIYGAYHHITVPGKSSDAETICCDITGSLCENNDKFAIQRTIPEVDEGDFLLIHDTGAHGHAMGFNYNGKLRSAELLLGSDGSVKLIRRGETLEDYLATLSLPSGEAFL